MGNNAPVNSQPSDRAVNGQNSTAAAITATADRTNGSLDSAFSSLARLATHACGASLASIAILECGEVWCTSSAQLPAADTPQHDPLALHTVRVEGLFEVPDTTLHERCRNAGYVNEAMAVR